jgi:hypothetical protein
MMKAALTCSKNGSLEGARWQRTLMPSLPYHVKPVDCQNHER